VSGQGSLELALIMKKKKERLTIGYFQTSGSILISLILVVYRLLQINFRVLHFGISLWVIILKYSKLWNPYIPIIPATASIAWWWWIQLYTKQIA
jgi:hypothetical protein